MVQLLLKAGHSPNTAKGWNGDSSESSPALHQAIDRDNLEIVKLLLAHKADLNVRNTYSQTPLHYAAHVGKSNVVELLIRRGANVNATTMPFDLACGSGEEQGPQLNTPLHFAAAAGNPATIKALLAEGAKINFANAKGATSLMSTIEPPIYTAINEKFQLENIKLLLSSGADVNAHDKDGRTVLNFAADLTTLEPAGYADAQRKAARQLIDLLKKHGTKYGKPLDESINEE